MIPLDGPTTPCTPLRTQAADGARLVACSHGGHVLGWTPAGQDGDRLWLSPLARCGPGEAIRGGIPVVFPQFSDRGPLPKHGLARNRAWELDHGSDGAPVARVAGRLSDDAGTRAVWPHRFTVSLLAEAVGDSLTICLEARNDAAPGGPPFEFTAALHAYLAVDAAGATLVGLAGRTAQDNAAGGAELVLPPGALPALGPRDLAVPGASEVQVIDADGSVLRITSVADDGTGPDGGFDAMVIWNPGRGHGLDDAPPDAAERFVCVEPARLTPVTLRPEQSWRAVARFTATATQDRPKSLYKASQ